MAYRNNIWSMLLALWLFPAWNGMAAPTNSPWFARVWQSDDGLPENNVTGVAQTPEGYLWISTLNGLARFDGVRFQNIPLPAQVTTANPMIRCLLLGRSNALWLALEGGIVVGMSPALTNVYTLESGLPRFRPMSLAQDAAGGVWIGYVDGSACRIAEGRVRRMRARDGLSGVGPCWVASDAKGRLWFAKAGRVGVFRDESFVTLLTPGQRVIRIAGARDDGVWICAGPQLLKYAEGGGAVALGDVGTGRGEVEPTCLFEDRSHALWIGTAANGLIRFDGTNSARMETSHAEIRSISEDREGNLWVGTSGGGLNRLQPRAIELLGTESGLPTETVRSLGQDAAGILWAAMQNGDLARLQEGAWTVVSTNDGWSGDKATCVVGDPRGAVWIGTWHGGLHRWQDGRLTTWRRSDGLGSDTVRALLVDSGTNLWIGLESSNCVQRLSDGQLKTFALPRSGTPVRAMAEDARGDLWMGTSEGDLFRVNGEALSDETARTLTRPKPIRCLLATTDGSLWIGYAGAGVGRLKAGQFTRLDSEQGLHDDYISQILADGRGTLWFAGNRGIFQVAQRELDAVMQDRAARVRSVVHGRDEALPNLQASYGYSPGALQSRDGRLWFPMRTGLAVVHSSRRGLSHLPPPVFIERLAVDGHPVTLPGGDAWWRGGDPVSVTPPLRLPPGHRKLEIDYTALSFVAPENAHFRHRLDGVDEDWIEAGAQRSVSYPRLPAGRYRFRVAACNSTGLWNMQGAELALVVAPFFWQTWWFRAAALAAFTLGVIGVVRYVSFRRLRQQLQHAERQAALHKERERIARDIHDDLGASLTQISLLGELAQQDLAAPDKDKAREHVEKLAAMARQGIKALDEIVWAVNPRNDTLAHLLDYTGQYAVDFLRVAGLRCRLDFPAQPPARALATEARHNLFLVVKEALHNIVKHAEASEVRLRATLVEGVLELSVEDNGRGFAQTPDSPLADGLRNMRQRVADIGGHCRIESRHGTGTAILLRLPLAAEPAGGAICAVADSRRKRDIPPAT